MTSVRRPLVIGHRGASGYRPEHTRAAYELAFALGADAVEPDIVASKDGVLVLRHENEISGTTDVAEHPELAHLRTTKSVDGVSRTGWFTEDLTWAQLATLRCRERMPELRTASASFDGRWGILRLTDLLELIDERSAALRRELVLVAEIKHAAHFASVGLPLDELFAAQVAGWATPANLIVESFELPVLGLVRDRGVPGALVFLAEELTGDELTALAGQVDGVSVDKALLLRSDAAGAPGTTELVDRAHALGLRAYTWTLRAENRFLAGGLRRGSSARDYGDWLTEFRLILGTGVDGVFADQPDLVVDALSVGAP